MGGGVRGVVGCAGVGARRGAVMAGGEKGLIWVAGVFGEYTLEVCNGFQCPLFLKSLTQQKGSVARYMNMLATSRRRGFSGSHASPGRHLWMTASQLASRSTFISSCQFKTNPIVGVQGSRLLSRVFLSALLNRQRSSSVSTPFVELPPSPLSLRVDMLAPFWSKQSTTFSCPQCAARWSGVLRECSRISNGGMDK